jgi:exonuclease III
LPAAITPNIIQTSRSKTLILIVAQLPSRSSRYNCGRVSNSHHILIGDLNTTRHLFDETGRSISGDHYLAGLEQAGWAEALRKCKPGKQEGSWFSSAGNGFRVDQAWLSPSLVPILTHAQLDHTVRELGYSDHSMLVVDLDI